MPKRKIAIVITLVLLALSAAALISAQEATVEPPTETVAPPITATLLPTVEVTVPSTAEVTSQPTSEATAQPTAAPTQETTAEATAEVLVTTTPMDHGAYLRVAHFAPDAPAVDVYINGTLTIRGLSYPSVSDWLTEQPGTYSISVTPSGSAASGAVIGPVSVTIGADTWQTIAVVGSSGGGTLAPAIITEDYQDLLPSTGGFTFFNAVEGSKDVNIIRNGVVFFAGLGFPGGNAASSSSLRVDSGTFDVSVSAVDTPNTTLAENPSLKLGENAYTLVALIGKPGNEQLFVHTTDAADVEIARGRLPRPGTLMEALRNNSHLTAFANALQQAGLDTLLTSSADYTIFAPADFTMTNMSSLSADQLATTLKGYIVSGKLESRDFLNPGTLTTLAGTTLTATTKGNAIFVDNAQVISLNIPATNGVIHMINSLLGTTQ